MESSQQVEQQSRELPEWIVLASLKPPEPQHWPFLLWKCTADCSRPTATCCLFEWPRRPPSAARLFPEDCFYCLCCYVDAHLWSIVRENGHKLFPFFYVILCLYFGYIFVCCVLIIPVCVCVCVPHKPAVSWLQTQKLRLYFLLRYTDLTSRTLYQIRHIIELMCFLLDSNRPFIRPLVDLLWG